MAKARSRALQVLSFEIGSLSVDNGFVIGLPGRKLATGHSHGGTLKGSDQYAR